MITLRINALCLVLLGALVACHQSDEPPLPNRPTNSSRTITQPLQTTTAESTKPPPDADPWVRRQVGELRDRTLKWTPRSVALHRLAFAGNRLYSERDSEILAIDPLGKQSTKAFSVPRPRSQLAALADGSLLAIAAESTLVIRPDAKHVETLRSVIVLPHESVYGNAGMLGFFDAFDAVAGRWSSYSFDSKPGISSLWLPDTAYDLPELKQGHCGELIDGTYACYAGERLWQLVTRSRPRLLGPCARGAAVWRVFPAARLDQAWLARNDSTLERWWLVRPPKRLSSIELPWTPLDIAVRGDSIAMIRLVQNRAQPKRLTLVVLDASGQQRFERPLFPDAGDEANAAEEDIRETEVVIHARQPWIGLRTSRDTRVLDLNTGATLVQVQ